MGKLCNDTDKFEMADICTIFRPFPVDMAILNFVHVLPLKKDSWTVCEAITGHIVLLHPYLGLYLSCTVPGMLSLCLLRETSPEAI